ncbi:hypothetical protein Goshw_008564 [Gossypium schwendimanii]|uniref:Uncharacterized protein n=1 Tax=Gossypium schwendimanii TaxID=34291 RepID=A0A7J9N772_GOSSC|nr:hypothetical protein [Gossypium schwendimanii]
MRPSKLSQKRHSMRKVIVWLRDIYQNCGTSPVLVYSILITGICRIC